MSGGEDQADRTHDPSERRLEEARRRGDVPRSPDVTAAVALAALLATAIFGGHAILTRMAGAGATLLAQADRIEPGAAATALAARMAMGGWPLLVLPAAAVLAVLVAGSGLTFVPDKIMPQLSRLSPFAALRQRFGAEGLVAFLRSLVKLALTAGLIGLWVAQRADPILGSARLVPGAVVVSFLDWALAILGLAVAIWTVIALADIGWQWLAHRRRNRMSRQDLVEEQRASEGDPHLKSVRRERGQAIATNRMLLDVARADVVIVNPTHYAVALRWDRASGRAPSVVAKGQDEVAARIRERAAAAGVPLHRDPPTARLLHATLAIGQEISPDHYAAVAAAIRFAEAMRRRSRHAAGPPGGGA